MTKEQLQYLLPLLNAKVSQMENMRHIVYCYLYDMQSMWTTQRERELFVRYKSKHPECMTYDDLWTTVCNQCDKTTNARNQVMYALSALKRREAEERRLL